MCRTDLVVVDLTVSQTFLLIVPGAKEGFLALGTHKMLSSGKCTQSPSLLAKQSQNASSLLISKMLFDSGMGKVTGHIDICILCNIPRHAMPCPWHAPPSPQWVDCNRHRMHYLQLPQDRKGTHCWQSCSCTINSVLVSIHEFWCHYSGSCNNWQSSLCRHI